MLDDDRKLRQRRRRQARYEARQRDGKSVYQVVESKRVDQFENMSDEVAWLIIIPKRRRISPSRTFSSSRVRGLALRLNASN